MDKDKPNPTPEPEGADVSAGKAVYWYRVGYEDAAHDFMKGVLLFTTLFVTFRLLTSE